jgi:hypothetical protein
MWTISAGVVLFAAILNVRCRKPSVSKAFQSIQFGVAELRQIQDADCVPDRAIGITGNLHLVAISLRVQFAHQPFSGIQSDPAIIGFKVRIVSDLQ